jgi:cobalt-zinc-cadmium efflux system outer membrane protein
MQARRSGSLQKPTYARFFTGLVLLVASHAAAQSSPRAIDEATTIARALARADVLERSRAELSAARARTSQSGAYPNPTISYLREQTFGAAGTGEDYVSAAQTIDLGNRYGLRRRAGEQREEAARLRTGARDIEIAAEARHRFYALVHGSLREHALTHWRNQLNDALKVISLREQHGDAALYDRRRLERERVMVDGLVERERIQNDTQRRLLGTTLGLSPNDAAQLEPRGQLLPILPDTKSAAQHPAQRALEADAGAARGDEVAARRLRVPDLRIEGGWKGVALQSGGRTDGFLVSGTLQLPFWDRGQGARGLAAADVQAVHAQQAALALTLRGDVDAYRGAAFAFRELAIAQRTKTAELSADLRRMAQAGYQSGELSVLELLDGYRGALEDELAVLGMEHAAREAAIEWQRARGEAPR